MKREFTLWLAVMALALHILEEHLLGFPAWSLKALGLNVPHPVIGLINASLIVFSVACAMVGWKLPEISLISPAILVINAIFFHLGLTAVQRLYSPGAVTSALLFLPAAFAIYHGAYRDGVLTRRALVVSTIGGFLLQLYLLVLLLLTG